LHSIFKETQDFAYFSLTIYYLKELIKAMVEGQVLQDELDKLQRQNPQTMIESQMKRKNWGIAEKPEIEVVVGDDVRCDQSKKQKPDDKNEQL
jgi:hypothetical protein